MGKKVIILGGGLSGISTAYFLQNNPDIDSITILEKENTLGGLCRSFKTDYNLTYDIGPHIFFSKNKEVLDFMEDVMMPNINTFRRSNIIIHNNKYIQYPFENDLSKLSREEKARVDYTFKFNPYADLEATDMRQFFLKTFGEEICKLYLLPYNEKIWKYDLSFMDLQMVERIPKPTNEELDRSLNGETVDGYLHQLNFSYPEKDGCQSFIDSFAKRLNNKVKIELNCQVSRITSTEVNNKTYDVLISTIPLNNFCTLFTPDIGKYEFPHITQTADKLVYNGIVISIVNVEGDFGGNNFAFMNANKDIIFHRVSKIDYFGKNYHVPDTTTFMVETTYRNHSPQYVESYLNSEIEKGLLKLFGISIQVNHIEHKSFDYAYVINDVNQIENKKKIFDYFKEYKNIYFAGRFGSWQYLNMDQVIENAKNVTKEISNEI